MRKPLTLSLTLLLVAGCEAGGNKKPATQPAERVLIQDPLPPKPAAEPPIPASKHLDPSLARAKVEQQIAELQALLNSQSPATGTPTPTPAAVAVVPVAPPAPPPPAPAATPKVEVSAAPLILDDVAAQVTRRVNTDPRDVANQIDMALLSYLKEEPAPDPKRVAPLPAEDRELISAIVDALTNLRASARTNPNATYQSRVKPLAELSERLRSRSDLSIPTLAMTTGVTSFGVYEPMPAALSSYGETPTVLYTEVANFSPQLNGQRQWETRLTSTLSLYNTQGRPVWSSKPLATTDASRNRRNDYFLATPLRLPPVPAGKYTLKSTITDLNANRVAEAVLALESK